MSSSVTDRFSLRQPRGATYKPFSIRWKKNRSLILCSQVGKVMIGHEASFPSDRPRTVEYRLRIRWQPRMYSDGASRIAGSVVRMFCGAARALSSGLTIRQRSMRRLSGWAVTRPKDAELTTKLLDCRARNGQIRFAVHEVLSPAFRRIIHGYS